MRTDAVGFFWNDAPVPKPPRPQAPKRTPPERTWERPDYLPGLAEAMQFPVPHFTDHELMSEAGGELYFDIECYHNFFQVAFMSTKTGKVIDFILATDQNWYPDTQRLAWITQNFTIKGFNSWHYDLPMLSFFMAGYGNAQLKEISDRIIVHEENSSDLLRAAKIKRWKCDHIDLKEVAPLFASLKMYGGRVHTKKMQDLPFNPHTLLSREQMYIVRWYCVNDLYNTRDVDRILEEQQKLRYAMSNEIQIDLRSKSDAQVAEAVIGHEVYIRNRSRPQVPKIDIGTAYRYQVPQNLQFQTDGMRSVLDTVRNTLLIVDHTGSIGMPPELKDLKIKINKATYTSGLGGLHSTEKHVCHRAVRGFRIFDVDVESYYPRIILNQGLYPKQLGPAFLDVFNQLVERRLHAKHVGDKVTAGSLKITINGTFGKLGNLYSILYAPDLLVQVTLSGQLYLLMLIELLEMYGCEVISANTDGICIKVHETKVEVMRAVVKYWESVTRFKTEENEYVALYSKDVNNYIAVKKDPKKGELFKGKGLYANPWSTEKDLEERLKKNPSASGCVDAVIALLTKGVPLRDSIYQCKDFTKFVSVRYVKGGAVKDGVYLGKAVRWYHATNQTSETVSAASGNKVPKTDGTKPCLVLPDSFPTDINYEWYVNEAESILKDIGYYA